MTITTLTGEGCYDRLTRKATNDNFTAIAAVHFSGAGTPEGAVVAAIGSIYSRTDGGANTSLYVKESGVGNTGWVAK